MATTETNNVVINKLSVEQYRAIKGTTQEKANEVYNLKDVDEHLVEMKDISGQNLNNLKGKVIMGYGNNCTNRPTDQNGFFLNLPLPTAPDTFNRQFYLIRTTHDLYTRFMEDGVWSDYKKIAQAPQIVTAYLASNYTVSTANANAYKSLYLAQKCKVGSKLEMSNGGIKIGNHISYVKISAQMQITPSGGAAVKHLRIYKGETVVGWANVRCTAVNDGKTLVIASHVIPVSAGDVLTLRYYASAGDVIQGAEQIPTLLTVEVVE